MRLFQPCYVDSLFVGHLRSLSASICSCLFCVDATSQTCGYPIPEEGNTPTHNTRMNESSERANKTNQNELMQPKERTKCDMVAAPYTLHQHCITSQSIRNARTKEPTGRLPRHKRGPEFGRRPTGATAAGNVCSTAKRGNGEEKPDLPTVQPNNIRQLWR